MNGPLPRPDNGQIPKNVRVEKVAKTAGPDPAEAAKAASAAKAAAAQKGPQPVAVTLLNIEDAIRKIDNQKELILHACNASRAALKYRQAFFLSRKIEKADFRVKGASSVATIDSDAFLIRWIERIVHNMLDDVPDNEQCQFSLPAYTDKDCEEQRNFAFPHFLWTPLIDRGQVIGGILAARDTPWLDNDKAVALRLTGVYAHAMRALKAFGNPLLSKFLLKKWWLTGIGVGLLILGCIPIPVSSVAPAEVAPNNPFVVAAPFSGVVKDILVVQGKMVKKGTPIIAFEDVSQRNEFDIATEEEQIAKARYLLSSQSALKDSRDKRYIAVAKAELKLATAQRIYAKELLDKTIIHAPRSGVILYTDKRDWMGQPVSAGEKIVEIADPADVRFAIDLPVGESIVLKDEAKIKVFLDADPLDPIRARLTESSYQPNLDKRGILSYQLSAQITDHDIDEPLRFGAQGTARIYANLAPLGYVVFRRPLVALRQFMGF